MVYFIHHLIRDGRADGVSAVSASIRITGLNALLTTSRGMSLIGDQMKSKRFYFVGIIALVSTVLMPATSVVASVCPQATCPQESGSCCPSEPSPNATTTFAIVGGNLSVGQELNESQLVALGVDIEKVDTLASGGQINSDVDYNFAADGTTFDASHTESPASGSTVNDGAVPGVPEEEYWESAAAIPTPNSTYRVVSSWKDYRNRTVYLRLGWNNNAGRGFGYKKVVEYHNLNTSATKALTKYPSSVKYKSGSAYEYRTVVHRIDCTGWWLWKKCRVGATTTMIGTVDFRTVQPHASGTFGVVTAYCSGYVPRCPSWVKKAANI